MKRGWGRRGFEVQQRALIWVVQAAGALVVIAALFFYIDDSMQGGLLAKHYYPGNFGQLATVVAQSQDSMSMLEFVSQHDKAVFSFSGQDNVIDVSSNRLPGKSRFWIFTPKGVTMAPFTLSPATGIVNVVKEGNTVTLRKGGEFNPRFLRCPSVVTTDANGLALVHVIDVPADDRMDGLAQKSAGDVATILLSRLGRNALKSEGGADAREQAARKATGVVLSLRVDPVVDTKNRIVAYYNARASEDIQLRSAKLGCLLINSLQRSGDLEGFIDGVAVVPIVDHLLPLQQPGVQLVIGNVGASKSMATKSIVIGNALMGGIEEYYHG